MPILATTVVTEQPPVEPPVDPGGGTTPGGGTGGSSGGGGTGTTAPPPVTDADRANPAGYTSYTLTASNGASWDLQDRRHTFMTLGRRGFDAPQYQVYASESPGFDGEVFGGARAVARDLILPVYLRADTRTEFLHRKRTLLASLSPRRGMAKLTVAEQDGSRRWINLYFSGRGAEGDYSRDQQGRMWCRYMLEFRAPDPYWRGQKERYEFSSGAGGTWFPFLPLRVSSSTTLGTNTINVPGDVEAFPVWTITGPTSGGIVLRYTPLDGPARSLLLGSVLSAGQSITINTDPTKLTILDQSGTNRWADLQSGSSLWPIPPGTVTIEVAAGGATTATRIALEVEPRYETV